MKKPVDSDQKAPLRYLALGDSYTIGELVDEKESFPRQVCDLLKNDGREVAKPDIIARTGWTTDELESAIHRVAPEHHYDLVTILIGVNNQYRGRDVGEYAEQFELLLRQAIAFAHNDTNHVVVLSIPDWGVTPFASGQDREKIKQAIDNFNEVNELLADKYRVHYINVTESTREAASDPSLLAPDGLHPSAKEYSRWAKKVAALMQEKL